MTTPTRQHARPYRELPQSARSRDSPGRACRSQASYKYPLKKYIFDFDGDAEYYAGKTKVMSSNWAPGYQWAIDENWNIINFGATSCSRVRLRERYGDEFERFLDRERMETWSLT